MDTGRGLFVMTDADRTISLVSLGTLCTNYDIQTGLCCTRGILLDIVVHSRCFMLLHGIAMHTRVVALHIQQGV